jgi:hypothetical protein
MKEDTENGVRLLALGPIFGPILCCIVAVEHWFYLFLEFVCRRDEIELVDSHWCMKEFRKACPDSLAEYAILINNYRSANRRRRNTE